MAGSYLIFGATGAIGGAIATELAGHGHQLHLAGRDPARLAMLAGQLGAPSSLFDAADETSIQQAVADASRDQPLAGLVWAVGSILLKPLASITADDMASTYQINVTGAALAIKAGATALKQGQGSVLLFSSVAAGHGFAAHGAIAAAKAGVEGLGRALAAELAPAVRVNILAPSLSHGRMAEGLINNKPLAEALARAHPLGRLGQAGDFAGLARILLDPQTGGWITGAVIPVDGGRATLHRAS